MKAFDERLVIRVPGDLLQRLDAWCEKHPPATRAYAVRWLVERGLREGDAVVLTRKPRPDGSIYVTCASLPGFHYILAQGESDTVLVAALDQFRALYYAAQRNGEAIAEAKES